MTSDRLKELQKLQNEVELGEIQPDTDNKVVQLGAGSYRVADSNEASAEEKKRLLRKKAVAQESQKSRLEPWKLYSIIGVTIVTCLLLLWALFSGATPDKYVNRPSNYKPLTFSELREEHAAGGRESPCPDQSWIPEECRDDRRVKSKSTLDKCNELFEGLEYTEEYLTECGLLQSGD